MDSTTTWRYDADQNDPLTALRIPVTSEYPRDAYLASFDGLSATRYGDTQYRPTGEEAAMLACYIGYLRSRYSANAQQRMLAEPLDVGELATEVFHKHTPGHWRYRRSHWTTGPLWAPYQSPPLTLAELLDHIHTCNGNIADPWQEWKAAHPGVFEGG
jgi:hypothetical protein